MRRSLNLSEKSPKIPIAPELRESPTEMVVDEVEAESLFQKHAEAPSEATPKTEGNKSFTAM